MTDQEPAERFKQEVREIVERLKQERDELHLQSHLLKAEMRDEWEQAEDKLRHIDQRFDKMLDEGKESAREIGTAIKLVGEEIAEAYRRIRKH